MISNCLLIVIATITEAVTNMNMNRTTFQSQMSRIKRFLDTKKIPKELRDRVTNYLTHVYIFYHQNIQIFLDLVKKN